MARSFGSQEPQARRKAQRRVAADLKAGRSPLGGKYREIVRKATLRTKRKQAHENFRKRLGHYLSYNDATVHESIYKIMQAAQIEWTVTADTEELRDRASAQTRADATYVILWLGKERNPWWYH